MKEYRVGKPNYKTKQRMKEVQFYLIINEMKKNIDAAGIYFENIIENLCMLNSVKYTFNRFCHQKFIYTNGATLSNGNCFN